MAPVGLFLHNEPEYAFRVACEIAAITHGHLTGYLAAGAFAMIIAEILNDKCLEESIACTINTLKRYDKHGEVLNAITDAMELSSNDIDPEKAIQKLGDGWIAEEALGIALYCAIKEKDFQKALLMSVNHNGDSDSTGSICGNLMGAKLGTDSIPVKWIDHIELKEFIENISDKLFYTHEMKSRGY